MHSVSVSICGILHFKMRTANGLKGLRNRTYKCVDGQVFALGFVSVFDQVLEGLPDNDREKLFNAYIASLDEDASKYRQVLLRACAFIQWLI